MAFWMSCSVLVSIEAVASSSTKTGRIDQHRAREGDKLLLSGRQEISPLADLG